jgi:hypothetical protein
LACTADAVPAGVVDADDNDRRDAAGGDQLLRRLVDAPLVAERCCLVEDILTVMQIQNGVPIGCRRVIVRRQVDQHGSVFLEVPRVEVLVGADVARQGVRPLGLLGVEFDDDFE